LVANDKVTQRELFRTLNIFSGTPNNTVKGPKCPSHFHGSTIRMSHMVFFLRIVNQTYASCIINKTFKSIELIDTLCYKQIVSQYIISIKII